MDIRPERYHVHRAVRIVTRFIQHERAMREKVLRHYPQTRAAKLAEVDQTLRAFTWLLERLYEARPDRSRSRRRNSCR